MNTLPSRIGEILLLQYADDTILILCSGSDPAATVSVMNQQLALIHDWLVEHRMRLNVHKSHVKWFHVGKCKLKSPHLQISIHGVSLKALSDRNTWDLFLTLSYRGIWGV